MKQKIRLNAAKVRQLRERQGFSSQAELSAQTAKVDPQHCGVGPRVIWDAENGKPVTARTWHLIAKALNVTDPRDLLLPDRRDGMKPRWIVGAGVAVAVALAGATLLVAQQRGHTRIPGDRPMVFADARARTTLRRDMTLSHDLLCTNLTILPAATLTTNGHSILCSGTFENRGRIVTGYSGYQDYPESYGGSGGGGGAGCNGIGGQSGYQTRALGGNGDLATSGGASPNLPALSAERLQDWYLGGMDGYLAGAAGGGNPAARYGYTGTRGAFGVYIQAAKIVAGSIVARAPDACNTAGCGPIDASGGGGGGLIVFAYGSGGLVPGRYEVRGGQGNHGGCYPSGPGGNGGVATYSFGQRPPIGLPQIASGTLRVRSREECTGAGQMGITNNTHGALSVVSGDGAFASVSPSYKTFVVRPDAMLRGHVRIQVADLRPALSTAPLVAAASWGERDTSWSTLVRSVPDGRSVLSPLVAMRAPAKPGAYALIFALQIEPRADEVASGTDWVAGALRWSGPDTIAGYNPSQIADAQTFGCAIARRAVAGGYAWFYVPSDALRIIARTNR